MYMYMHTYGTALHARKKKHKLDASHGGREHGLLKGVLCFELGRLGGGLGAPKDDVAFVVRLPVEEGRIRLVNELSNRGV